MPQRQGQEGGPGFGSFLERAEEWSTKRDRRAEQQRMYAQPPQHHTMPPEVT